MRALTFLAAAFALICAPAFADTISGTNKADSIVSTAGDDTITTGRGADKIYLHGAFGTDHVTDFNAAAGDRIVFDINGCYSDILYLGQITDGLVVQSCNGGRFEFNAVGGSTQIKAYSLGVLQGTLILDGVAINSLYGSAFQGG